MSSDDDCDLRQPRAFAVEGESEPTHEPPATAEEYLRQVRWQANRCPDVVVAKNAPSPKKNTIVTNIPVAPNTPTHLKPSKQWEDNFLVQFNEFRDYLAQQQQIFDNSADEKPSLPPINAANKWKEFCFGPECKKPTPPIILQLDHVSHHKILKYHIKWLLLDQVTPQRTQWMYILLARLELPLSPDCGSHLFSLAERCIQIRSEIKDQSDIILPHLNIIITLVQKFFGQVVELDEMENY